jgi:hypothetical protein
MSFVSCKQKVIPVERINDFTLTTNAKLGEEYQRDVNKN